MAGPPHGSEPRAGMAAPTEAKSRMYLQSRWLIQLAQLSRAGAGLCPLPSCYCPVLSLCPLPSRSPLSCPLRRRRGREARRDPPTATERLLEAAAEAAAALGGPRLCSDPAEPSRALLPLQSARSGRYDPVMRLRLSPVAAVEAVTFVAAVTARCRWCTTGSCRTAACRCAASCAI